MKLPSPEGKILKRSVLLSELQDPRVEFPQSSLNYKGKEEDDLCLEESFPTSFSIATSKDSWIAKVSKQLGEGGRWSLRFSR